MAYRFTNTDKWEDSWFSELKPLEKLLFIYLCDNCDIGGFIEVVPKRWANDIGVEKAKIEGALEGLQRGLTYSLGKDCVYLRNFLKHQKNTPLDPERNPAHRGIIKRFETYSLKFNIISINDFILEEKEGATKGLRSPIGNGKGIGKEIGGVGERIWRTDFELYKEDLRKAFKVILKDEKWISEMERYHPFVDIPLSVEKACMQFWSKEAGWKNKKTSKTVDIDWKATFTNALDMKSNQVRLLEKKEPEKPKTYVIP